ncbi:hypothetical protein Ana3638_18565 [Anaerocolumna sedimenticola]|uniref:Uncharacterized protein n=1 Tax=Anaerocolumna sedimenticola TaxID=2696063 RepID=A0A6P1TSU8_9FIRM|nr:hypothetical protein [Anaerocolumna sedimenticola]QHQ62538.1 hypothetical protein Ana3638_18565 [Anaerocolumna sedimenticola]
MKKKKELNFEKIFKGKKIPILTLDERWHELFPDYDKPAHIKEIEAKLNELIKQQGKLASDMKDMKALKNKLMQEIITHMDVNDSKIGKIKAKTLDRNQRYIKELSEKMNRTEDELIELPYQIKAINEQLIVESAKVCYERLNSNNKKVAEIALWVSKIRNELKEKILEKQDMEMKNTAIYSYMHDMLGPELLQGLDEELKNSL